MKREYSKKVAPFLLAGFFWWALSFPLARYLRHQLPAAWAHQIGTVLFGFGFFLWGLGFFYWALAKGRSTTNFLWGLLPPAGLVVMALLSDKYKNAPRDQEL